MNSNPKIKFVPLINFNKKEIINFLSKSKIYIDFGIQDKTNARNCYVKKLYNYKLRRYAYHFEDVPIDDEFKFDEKNKNLSKINTTINQIFNNYTIELKNLKITEKN